MLKKTHKKLPDPLYKKIHANVPIACVDIIIVNGRDEFLLVKRKNKPAQGLWWFPGGRILRDELLADAARRKAHEETGIMLKKLKPLGADETLFPDGPFGNSTHTINLVFSSRIGKRIKLKLDKQSEDYAWFSKIDKKWHPYIKKFLSLGGFKQ